MRNRMIHSKITSPETNIGVSREGFLYSRMLFASVLIIRTFPFKVYFGNRAFLQPVRQKYRAQPEAGLPKPCGSAAGERLR